MRVFYTLHMSIKKHIPALLLLLAGAKVCTAQTPPTEKTAFQTSRAWMPEIDTRADIAIVYGVNGNPSDHDKKQTFENRVKSWQDEGYLTHFMTGIAWGSYEDYFLGNWDGKPHFDEGQVQQNGDTIWHGHNVPYIVPTDNYLEYFKDKVIKRVIDAGVTSIYLEEPEFWARSGYSESFKDEWKKFYGTSWKPQHESPENTWLANKLKYHLYYNALDKVSAFAKAYGKSKNLDIKVYVPTHSLINYSSWAIVSPEASLASLPGIDGYIAQVWTGTSREPVFYNGIKKERTFENAYLEYGSMVSMTKPTGRKMFFLTDPIEDRRKTWEDYKLNYQATFIGKLMYPSVDNYEVMPWPERIYTSPYSVAGSDEKILIPRDYSTQMQVMINTLNDMPRSDNSINGSDGIDVLLSNSLMFQRFPNHDGYDDPQLSNFYGLTLPLIKKGIPVGTVHMENLNTQGGLADTKVLVMTYANLKPTSPKDHEYLAKWVKDGGTLVFVGRDDDPFQEVQDWWNRDFDFKAPSGHLFKTLGVDPKENQEEYTAGKGKVYILRQNPKELVMQANGDGHYLDLLKQAYTKTGEKWVEKNNFHLQRGPYEIAAVLDESTSAQPLVIKGPVIDLFDPEIPLLESKKINPGEQALLYNLDCMKGKKPQVLATAARVTDEKITHDTYTFTSRSPVNTDNVMRIYLNKQPKSVGHTRENGEVIKGLPPQWDAKSHTLLVKFENQGAPVTTTITW